MVTRPRWPACLAGWSAPASGRTWPGRRATWPRKASATSFLAGDGTGGTGIRLVSRARGLRRLPWRAIAAGRPAQDGGTPSRHRRDVPMPSSFVQLPREGFPRNRVPRPSRLRRQGGPFRSTSLRASRWRCRAADTTTPMVLPVLWRSGRTIQAAESPLAMTRWPATGLQVGTHRPGPGDKIPCPADYQAQLQHGPAAPGHRPARP